MFKRVQIKIFALTIIVGATILAGIFAGKQLDETRIKVLRETRVVEETKRLEQIYNLLDKTLEAFVFDYTYWDEMYNFVKSPSKSWAKENIDQAIPKHNVQFVWVLNRQGKVVYSYNQYNDSLMFNIPIEEKNIKSFTKKTSFAHFFLQTHYGMMEVRTAPIQPGADYRRMAEPAGFYVAARLWTKEYLYEISAILSGKVILVPRGQTNEDKTQSLLSPYDIIASKRIYDTENKPVATIYSVIPSRALVELHTMNNSQFIRSMIFLFALLVIIISFLYHFINKPLKNISKSISETEAGFMAKYITRGDEFGEIARYLKEAFGKAKQLNVEIEERRKAEQRCRTLFESNPAAMLIYDQANYKILEVNNAAISHYGYTAEEFLQMTLKDLYPPYELAKLEKSLSSERQPIERSGPWKHRKKDGNIIHVELISHEMKYHEKTEARYALVNDITEIILKKNSKNTDD
jgi:PAS domain S-box-containing protein